MQKTKNVKKNLLTLENFKIKASKIDSKVANKVVGGSDSIKSIIQTLR